LRDVPDVLHVRHSETTPDRRSWKFLVDVSASPLFSKPDRLFYDVRRGEEALTGELYLCLRPPNGRLLRFAIALGVAVTLQGVGALFHFLGGADSSLEAAFGEFRITSHYQLLFVFAIPVVWAALRFADWLQYRLRT
jgi:hypothetical protein